MTELHLKIKGSIHLIKVNHMNNKIDEVGLIIVE